MTDTLLILTSAILVNNFVLSQFLGLCPFMGTSNKLDTAYSMALATAFVMTLASVSSYATYHYILVPLSLEYLRTISFIVVIAATVQFIEMLIHRVSPMLHRVLGIFLPLITTNCAVLGVALLNLNKQNSFFESALYGLGGALGFSLVLILFAPLREHLVAADIPDAFKGTAIGFITVGIVALGFLGFTGLVNL
jgi:Na+-translocating ferredoxin:NAD+ oxidoreductase subunit A